MTVNTSNVRELTSQVLALSVADRCCPIEAIARSLQTDIAPADGTNGTTDSEQSPTEVSEPTAEDAKNVDDNGNGDPLLVWLASLEPLDEDFPGVDEGLLPLDDICL
ncbi:MAG: hypothetical protein ACFB9N_07955 [Geitlerinemataceae cyanobacterium]